MRAICVVMIMRCLATNRIASAITPITVATTPPARQLTNVISWNYAWRRCACTGLDFAAFYVQTVGPVSECATGQRCMGQSFCGCFAGWRLRLTRPVLFLLSTAYVQIVGPVSECATGQRCTGRRFAVVLPGGGFALPGLCYFYYQRIT